MIGVVRRNSSRKMFISDGQLVLKRHEAGNIDQRFPQTNDFVMGEIGPDRVSDFANYQGGDRNDPNNYSEEGYIDKNDYPIV